MAITKLKTKDFVSEIEYGYTSINHIKVRPGESIPMYIPIVMPDISNGTPRFETELTRGGLIFANDNSCRPKVENKVKTQNFVSPTLENNNTFENIVTDEDPIVKRGTRFQCKFTNRNLQNIKFMTNQ